MNDDERDELLIRMDERQQSIISSHETTHNYVKKVHSKVEEVEKATIKNSKRLTKTDTQINLLKWLGTVGAALASYFKWGQ